MPTRLIILCALIIGLLCPSADAQKREPAPKFTAKTMDGETFTNDSVRGKVVLLEFWTTWCGYCLAEAPFVEKIHRDYDKSGLIVLTVNVGESKNTVKKYLDKHPKLTRVVLMSDTNLAAMFQANAYPIYVVIDKDGNIAATQRGAGGEDKLRGMLEVAGLRSDQSSSPQ
jgi:thiol-disulfide isomerase/thioredoxin